MEAIIRAQLRNGYNYSNEKELISSWSVVGKIKEELREIVAVRCYMGRSRNASTVYAAIWVNGAGIYTSGKGSAGGHGYHKISAAVGEAIKSAGIELYDNPYGVQQYIDGIGNEAIEEAITAIAKAAGSQDELLIIHI